MAVATGLPDVRAEAMTGQRPVIAVANRAVRLMFEQTAAVIDDLETGGILLGTTSGTVADVRHAGTAGPNAVRERTRFTRDREHAAQFAKACFAADASQWIGEWHTHPGGQPIPSEQDLITYGTLMRDDDLHLDAFVALIVAPSPGTMTLAGWWCELGTVRAADIHMIEGRSLG